jgi:Raf kinase inhibitor-like YbhB/YbcL family protein
MRVWLGILGGGIFYAQMWVRIGEYEPGAYLSAEHTCDGGDVAPLIRWGGAPAGTKAYVMRMYDPDAPADTFTHWLVVNVKGTEWGPRKAEATEGYNDFGQVGYGGPCPPPRDEPHRYVVEVYALAQPLAVRPPLTWEKVRGLVSAQGVAKAETFVRYKRQRR